MLARAYPREKLLRKEVIRFTPQDVIPAIWTRGTTAARLTARHSRPWSSLLLKLLPCWLNVCGIRRCPARFGMVVTQSALESCVGDTLSYVTGTRGATRHDDGVDTTG
jgi:hypothetical protein